MFSTIYNEIVYRPLLNVLIFFYNWIPGQDLGLAIIVITFLIRLAMAPSFQKSLKSQKAMANLQPKLTELREKHKNNKEQQAKAMMDLYKEHGVNPLSSCLPLFIQLPVFIGLYQVFSNGLQSNLSGLYSFVHRPENVHQISFGFLNLAETSIVLALLAAGLQFVQSKMMMPKNQAPSPSGEDFSASLNKNMLYMMPLMTIFAAWQFKIPSGLLLYWVATTVFSIGQQYYVLKK